MRSDKPGKKLHKRNDSVKSKDRDQEREKKIRKSQKSKKKTDWRDLLMEEDDYFLPKR